MSSMTGRHLVPRPKTRPLPPPQRFRPVARWKSGAILCLLVLVIVLMCVGGVELAQLNITIGGPTPAATPTATRTALPTVSPTRPAH